MDDPSAHQAQVSLDGFGKPFLRPFNDGLGAGLLHLPVALAVAHLDADSALQPVQQQQGFAPHTLVDQLAPLTQHLIAGSGRSPPAKLLQRKAILKLLLLLEEVVHHMLQLVRQRVLIRHGRKPEQCALLLAQLKLVHMKIIRMAKGIAV
ncbi:hypothetical protein D3C75_689910 [compost metagenome]